jgi:hypothetical protein
MLAGPGSMRKPGLTYFGQRIHEILCKLLDRRLLKWGNLASGLFNT